MPWVRIDENFADHPKVERVGPLAAWLHVAALCYSSRHLTDGHIPKAKAVRLAEIPDPAEHVSALLSEGIWVDNGTDYIIHDFLDYQPSRESVLAERSAARDRMAKRRSADRSPELPPNTGRSSPSPSRPDPDNDPVSRRLVTHDANGTRPDDDDLSTEIPDDVWTHYAELKLAAQHNIRNPGPWKQRTATNARTELAEQAGRWWHDYELTPYRLAQALVAGTVPAHTPRRNGNTPT